MNRLTDQQLLRDYAGCRSEAAFAELVRRHVDLVYSAALRLLPDPHLAQDVTQQVFLALAQNAQHVADHPVLAGWLHRTTRNLAAETVRSNVRRQAREREAAAMNELIANPPDNTWENIAPHLDAALDELSDADRHALLLRYFERKSAQEMAQTLGISDEAAQKRVSRAVERLREFLARRGVTVGAGGLAVLITANAVQAAPAGLVVTISAAASALTAATLTTATKAIAMTTLQKTLVTTALVATLGTGAYEAWQASNLREQNQTLQQQQASLAGQLQELQQGRDDFTNRLAALLHENASLKSNGAELLRLRGEMTRLKAQAPPPDNVAAKSPAQSWLSRVDQLKQRLLQDPSAQIPELQYVTDKDWLDAARGELNTETDYRRALSALRGAGERKAVDMMKKALASFRQNSGGQSPTNLSQLQPYFDSPVDTTVLQRWEIPSAAALSSLGMGGDIMITQKAPVDDVFDTRFGIGPGGWASMDFLQGTRDAMKPVYDAYRAAHAGQWPSDISQYQPYVTTPEQQVALQKLILHNATSK